MAIVTSVSPRGGSVIAPAGASGAARRKGRRGRCAACESRLPDSLKNKLPGHLSTSHSPKIHDSCSSERLMLDFRSFSTASAALDARDQKDPPPGDSGATQRRSAEDRAPCSATSPKLPAKEGG